MTQRIHCILEEAVNSGLFLGLSFVALDQYGKTLYSGAHGYRTFDRKEKMTLQTGGWVASMTKLMTSVAAMHAVENGLIGLDDDLANIIPEICKKEVLVSFDDVNGTAHFEKSNKAITLRLLLTHSSGFAYPLPGTMLARWAQANDKTMAKFYGDFARLTTHTSIPLFT
ncbi:beta-lactamase/transpeptidase-like protein [Aspergillus californicus]